MATRRPPMRPLIRRDAPVVVGTRSRRRVHVSPLTSRHRVTGKPRQRFEKFHSRRILYVHPSSSSLPRSSKGEEHPARYVTGGREGNRCTQAARRVARNFSNTACVFFPGWRIADRSVIGVTSDRALEVKSEDRGEQLVTAAVEIAWTMPGPYAFRAFLSWPGTVSRGCMYGETVYTGEQW